MNLEAIERLALIRRRLSTAGTVRVVELASELDVSEMTIRRALDLLAEEGVAQRVRGGAVAIGPQRFAERAARHARAKSRIADKLVGLVGSRGAIGLDASSTLQRLATKLGAARDLTVLTNGLDSFRALQGHPGVSALLTGGALDEATGSLVGPLASRSTRDVVMRRLFVSASALDAGFGSTESTLLDAEVKLAMAEAASDVVLAVDSSKLGHRAPARCFALDAVSLLVTELAPNDPRLDPYRDLVDVL